MTYGTTLTPENQVSPSVETLQARITQLECENAQLTQENSRLERENHRVLEQVQSQVDELNHFSMMQRVSAKKISYAHQKLYNALVELYPGLLQGTPTVVNPFKTREAAGWVSERTSTDFFSAMQAVGAIRYELQSYNASAEKDEDKRPALVTPNSDVFNDPRNVDLVSTDKLKKQRDADRKKKQEQAQAWRQWNCDVCGSPNITYDLIAVCKCGHRHTPKTNIVGEAIAITTVEHDDLFDEQGEPDWDALASEHEADNIVDFPAKYFANDMPEDEIPWKKARG